MNDNKKSLLWLVAFLLPTIFSLLLVVVINEFELGYSVAPYIAAVLYLVIAGWIVYEIIENRKMFIVSFSIYSVFSLLIYIMLTLWWSGTLFDVEF